MGNHKITSRPTSWRVITSASNSLGIGEVLCAGKTSGSLYISQNEDDDADSPGVVKLDYFGVGLGVGASAVAVDGSISTEWMWNDGWIFHGEHSNGTEVRLADLTGIAVVRVSSLMYASLTEVFFSPVTTAIPRLCKAVAIIVGEQVIFQPTVSVMEYNVYMRLAKIRPAILKSKDIAIPVDVRSAYFVNVPPVECPADSLFDFNRATLRPAADFELQRAASIIARRRATLVGIVGHTDSIGSNDYNDKLSLQRAEAVKGWMIGHGVPNAQQFLTVGLGKRFPKERNSLAHGVDNPAGRQANRRVEIVFLPDGWGAAYGQ